MKKLLVCAALTLAALGNVINVYAYNPKALSMNFSEAYDSITGLVGVKLGGQTCIRAV